MKALPRKLPRIGRKRSDDLPGITATARLDRRTKNLATRLCPGDIAIIDHTDLDRTGADALIGQQVGAVVNAARSISGRYPNRGPQLLLDAGIPLIDDVGPEVFDRVQEGQPVRLDGDTLYAGEQVVAKGRRQDQESVASAMTEAKASVASEIEAFAANTLEYIKHEYPLLIDGIGVPPCAPSWRAGTRWSWSAATATARTWPRSGPTSASASRSWSGWTAARTRCSRPATGPT
jgi:uncharacterized membrane-anchored protein